METANGKLTFLLKKKNVLVPNRVSYSQLSGMFYLQSPKCQDTANHAGPHPEALEGDRIDKRSTRTVGFPAASLGKVELSDKLLQD